MTGYRSAGKAERPGKEDNRRRSVWRATRRDGGDLGYVVTQEHGPHCPVPVALVEKVGKPSLATATAIARGESLPRDRNNVHDLGLLCALGIAKNILPAVVLWPVDRLGRIIRRGTFGCAMFIDTGLILGDAVPAMGFLQVCMHGTAIDDRSGRPICHYFPRPANGGEAVDKDLAGDAVESIREALVQLSKKTPKKIADVARVIAARRRGAGRCKQGNR